MYLVINLLNNDILRSFYDEADAKAFAKTCDVPTFVSYTIGWR